MSDIHPDTHVRMQTLRRFSHYNRGEFIAVPIAEALSLHQQGLATPLNILVPADAVPAEPQPVRQPGAVVRK